MSTLNSNSLSASSKIHASKSNPNLVNNDLIAGSQQNAASNNTSNNNKNQSSYMSTNNPSISITNTTNTSSSLLTSTNYHPLTTTTTTTINNHASYTINNATSALESILSVTNSNSSPSSCLNNSPAGSLVGNAHNIVLSSSNASGLNSSLLKKPGVTFQSNTGSYSSNDERQLGFYQEAKSSRFSCRDLLFVFLLILKAQKIIYPIFFFDFLFIKLVNEQLIFIYQQLLLKKQGLFNLPNSGANVSFIFEFFCWIKINTLFMLLLLLDV